MGQQSSLVGVYPGSFDPLTVAHLAVADAAVARFRLVRLDLVMSRVPLAKERAGHAPLEERVRAIEATRDAGRPWLSAGVTDDQLIADIAAGYDVCVMGADKWHQLFDVAFYGGSVAAREAALARLPVVAVAPREDAPIPPDAGVVILDIPSEHRAVSSTAVRDGRDEWRA